MRPADHESGANDSSKEGGSTVARRAGRQQRIARRAAPSHRAPYISRQIATYDILSEEGLCLIERNADAILRDKGIEVRNDPDALDLYRDGGADVQGNRVRFDPGLCRKIISESAPSAFVQQARNPDNNVVIGGANTVLAPSWGPPFVHDLDRGRRYAQLSDFHELVKIHQTIPWLHHSGGIVCEPVDVPTNKRHLDILQGHFRYSDRACFGALIGEARAADSIAMAKIVFGDEFVEQNCVLYSVANTNAPLVLDSAMSGALRTYAKHNQAVACTPWTLAGAMSPCTVAGTLAQVLAEAMAVCALTQLVRPGAPCLMGSFATAISMQSGAPTFGTPEAAKLVLASGQLARRLGLPLHTVGALSASKLPDAQAEQEAVMGLTMAILSGANFINHATGWLEGGLVTGYEKTMIDADLCGKLMDFCRGIDLSEEAQALEAIYETEPGAHYLANPHTLRNFDAAFYRSNIADNNAYEQWQADGARDAAQRANGLWKKALEDYQEPAMDPAIWQQLDEFVVRRKESMPDQWY